MRPHFYADVKRGVRKERCPEREVVGKERCPEKIDVRKKEVAGLERCPN